MRKSAMLFAAIVIVTLSGCVSDKKLSGYVCRHRASVKYTANTTISAAGKIKDPVARQAAIDGANALLTEVAACPPAI